MEYLELFTRSPDDILVDPPHERAAKDDHMLALHPTHREMINKLTKRSSKECRVEDFWVG